jgi:dUTP pyrophosphatase
MEQNNLEDYINKLKQMEENLNDDESDDLSYVNELSNLLSALNTDVSIESIVKVSIKKLSPDAVIPTYSKDGDAGMDLTAVSKEITDDYISYKTGLSFEIPKGYVGLLFPRSSNSKKDLLLTNSVGVIDSGYRGEVELRFKPIFNNKLENIPTLSNKLQNISTYDVGDRVGQIMILPYPKIQFVETDKLSESERGDGGFGSTGL